MKTTYQKPEMKVIAVAQRLMQGGSTTLEKYGSTTISSNDDVLSRRGSIWGDDEEED